MYAVRECTGSRRNGYQDQQLRLKARAKALGSGMVKASIQSGNDEKKDEA
jgi:hypothetical protein